MQTTPSATPGPDDGGRPSEGLRHVLDETDQFLRSAAVSGDQKLHVMRDKIAEQMRQMRTQLDTLEEVGLKKAKEMARATDETVHAHPYEAIGIAAAVGLLIGFLAARR